MSNRHVWMPGWPTMQQTPIGDPTLSLPRIFLYHRTELSYGKRQMGEALAEDGVVLYTHRSTDGDRHNNAPCNLVLCQDTKYHRLLHQRQRSLDACGHATWRKCVVCKKYDPPERFMWRGVKRQPVHRECNNTASKMYRNAKRARERMRNTVQE